MKEHQVTLALVGLLIAIIISIIALSWPSIVTGSRLDSALLQVQQIENPAPRTELSIRDGWDRPIIFRFFREPKRLAYRVISKGSDGVEGTEDDNSREMVDHNYSRIVGEWTAGKAKEFIKGAKEGISKKSKFDEPEAEKK